MGALDYLKEQLAELEAQGLALHPRTLEGPTGARARFDGREVVNLASNNYLGLANHPRMNAAAARAASELGAGTGAVRTIAGTMALHRELERRFAAFKHAESALMFQSGFTANAGTVQAILTPEDVIVSDRLNHASIIDGARLSKAEITPTACSPRPPGPVGASCSSPTGCSRWTGTSRPCPSSSRSPSGTARS
jgi:glycine C-acetyltransferase